MPKFSAKRRLSAKQKAWLSSFVFFGVIVFAVEAFFQFPSKMLLKAAGSRMNPETASDTVQWVCLALPVIPLFIAGRWQS